MSEKMFNSYDDKPSPGADDLFLLWDNTEQKVKNVKVKNVSKYTESKFPTIPTVPTTLPNPQALTITYGNQTHTYDGSEALAITIETGGIERIEKLSTDTTVTLDPNKLYIFPEMSELTIALEEPSDTGIANEYHFVFQSGATATTLSIPDTIKIPSGFSVDVNKIYEISILEGCLCAQSWAVTA